MNILAFNSSPRKNKGTTDIILNYFLDAAEQAGASIKRHYVTDLNIKGCIGCFTCWTKTPGKCIHHDDMEWIISEYSNADIIILATPIYNGNIIHYLQRMMERFLPTALPWQIKEGETTQHPARYQQKPKLSVLVATAGFPDHQAFNIAKALYPNSLHITLPSSQIIADPSGTVYVGEFIAAVKKVATQLVQNGSVDEEIKEMLNVQFSPEIKQMIREQANKHFETQLSI